MLRKQIEGSEPLTGNERYEGFFIDLISEIAKYAGIDYKIRLTRDQSILQENGTWAGIMGHLVNKVKERFCCLRKLH